jgi:hypothetical protein
VQFLGFAAGFPHIMSTASTSEVEETLRRLKEHKGVIGVVIVNQDGIPIRTTLDQADTVKYAGLITQLCSKARSAVRELDPQVSIPTFSKRNFSCDENGGGGAPFFFCNLPACCCVVHLTARDSCSLAAFEKLCPNDAEKNSSALLTSMRYSTSSNHPLSLGLQKGCSYVDAFHFSWRRMISPSCEFDPRSMKSWWPQTRITC